jgi:hypothetical protein
VLAAGAAGLTASEPSATAAGDASLGTRPSRPLPDELLARGFAPPAKRRPRPIRRRALARAG